MDSSSKPDSGGKDSGPWLPAEPAMIANTSTNHEAGGTNSADEIQLSLQGANVDMVVQWLAQTTGKTVIKHPRVQCQVTITSSKKVSKREAIVLVYRALALEGYSAIESGRSILIVPAGQEPKMSPELVAGPSRELPEGRERLVKVFALQHIQAAEVRDRLKSALTERATIDINERNNQIIITDYNDNLRIAGELIEALDTDQPEDMAVRAIPLKNVNAAALAKELGPLYQKAGGKSVDVTADERANTLIVLSSSAAFENIDKLVLSLDTEGAQEKTMETYMLKNADAQDVARQLQDLNQNSSVNSRYVYYFSSPTDSGQKKFNVVADRRRNAVIVQAAPGQMEGIQKIIEELDAPVSDDSLSPKIYPLKYVSAVDLEDVLNELFLKRTPQRSYFDFFSDEGPSSTPDRDVGRLYGKVRIISDPYSNTLIITSNSKENLAVVEDVIKQLDRPSEAGESTMRIGLKYAKADTVAKSLNILFAKNGSPPLRGANQPNPGNNQNQQQPPNPSQTESYNTGFGLEQENREEGYYPWIGGQPDNLRGSGDTHNSTPPVSDLVGRVRAVEDHRGNAVLVSANVHFFPQVLKLINELDAPANQVSIEARILEVSSDFLDAMGVRYSPDGKQVFTANDYDNSFIASGSGNYQQGVGGNTSVNTPSGTSSQVAQAITQLRSGVIQGTIGMDVLVQFLKKTADATVLGEPQITINDNEMGKLFVGQQVPVPQNTQVSSVGSQNTAITYKDVGVVLEVTPHINNSGEVQLKIHVESSSVVPGETVLGGAVFDTRNFRTDLTSQDGQTRVLAGIIQRQISDINRKTPVLGDIPGLGWLFKKRDKSSTQVELMVFLRTKVIRNPEAAEDLLNDINQRAPALKKWEDESSSKPKG